jgi:hypothetical protein
MAQMRANQSAQGQAPGSPSAATTNLDGAGASQLWDTVMQTVNNIPGQLEALQGRMNTAVQNIPAGAKTAASRTARYAPGAAVALGQFGQGNILEGLGATGGTALAGQLVKNLPIPGGPLAKGAVKGAVAVGASLLGGIGGGVVGHAVSGIGGQLAGGLGQLMGGAQTAAQNVANTVGGVQREAGTSAGSGREVGLGGMSDQEFNRLKALEQMGINTKLSYAQSMMPLINQQKQNDFVRFMQANQQQGQITGALNRQARAYDLVSQSSAENTAITQQMLASNPYAQVAGNFASARA